MLKEQVEKLLQENDIWKRGFKTLHGQKEEFDRCIQELQHLKHMMAERDDQLKKLQVAFTISFLCILLPVVCELICFVLLLCR